MKTPQQRILVAIIFGVLIVCGAYIAADAKPDTVEEQIAQLVERKYVKPEDSDKNGVPDWQDELLRGETINVESASSTYEKPTTLTGRFGLSFYENMVRSKMYGAFGDSPEELAANSFDQLQREAVDELLTEKDITIFESADPNILRSYGNQVATILTSDFAAGDSELYIIDEYLRYEDAAVLLELEPIARSYTTIVKNLLQTQVPAGYTKQHLDLLNTLNAVREDVRGMQKIETDPLYTLLRMKRYEDDVLGMQNAIKNLFNTLYLQDGIRWNADEPVRKLMVFPE
jgi:hypothetical protein